MSADLLTAAVPAGPPDRAAAVVAPGHLMARDLVASRWSWRHTDADAAGALWNQLVDFVLWLDDRYLRHQSSQALRIPGCWYEHPAAVEELTALLAAWQAAYCTAPPAPGQPALPAVGGTDGPAHWHTYLLWPTLQRLASYAGWADCDARDGHKARAATFSAFDPDLTAGLDVYLADTLAAWPEPGLQASVQPDDEHDDDQSSATEGGQDAHAAGALDMTLSADDVLALLRSGQGVALLPDNPASPVFLDGGWWARAPRSIAEPGADGFLDWYPPVLDPAIAEGLDEHYTLTRGHTHDGVGRRARGYSESDATDDTDTQGSHERRRR